MANSDACPCTFAEKLDQDACSLSLTTAIDTGLEKGRFMFGKKKAEDAREKGRQATQAMLDAIGELYDAYNQRRLLPLRGALLEVFVKRVEDASRDAIDPNVIRQFYTDCEAAWMSELPQIKMEILGFRDMEDWLKVADVAGARGQVLDWIDGELEEALIALRLSAAAKIGSIVLTHGLDDNE